MKKYLITLLLICAAACNLMAQDELDERRVDEGIRQIEQSNYNYFRNEGWYTAWNTLSGWYADVVLTNEEAKARLKRAMGSREIYRYFDDLNYKKQAGNLNMDEVDRFNAYLEKLIWRQIDMMYPPIQ